MKHLRIIALVTLLTMISADTFGASLSGNGFWNWFRSWWRERKELKYEQNTTTNEPVGAPLDGGLLVLLGAAGVAYYGVRRRIKNKEEK